MPGSSHQLARSGSRVFDTMQYLEAHGFAFSSTFRQTALAFTHGPDVTALLSSTPLQLYIYWHDNRKRGSSSLQECSCLFWLATCILFHAEDRAYGPSKGHQNKYDRSVQSSYRMNSNDAISKAKWVHIIKIQMAKKKFPYPLSLSELFMNSATPAVATSPRTLLHFGNDTSY